MNITIHKDGHNFGPYTLDQVKEYLASGQLQLSDLAFYEGARAWVSLAQIQGLNPAPPPPRAPPPPPRRSAQVPSTSSVPYMVPVSRTSSLAIWAMICGLLSFFCIPFTGIVSADIFPFVTITILLVAVAATILGHTARNVISKNPGMSGRGMALTGLIIGYSWITVFCICFIIQGLEK